MYRDLRETRSKIYCLEELRSEINSAGSFLSVTQSEDHFLDVSGPSKGWKTHRPSYSEHSGVFVGGKNHLNLIESVF